MSITLVAYPMAFLINPADAKSEKLRSAKQNEGLNKAVATQNLKEIKVLTNIKYDELHKIMSFVRYEVSSNNTYIYDSGLKVKWDVYGKYAVAHLFGDIDSDCLQTDGEKYFQTLDKVAQRNVRLIDSAEFFYYRYDTSYKKISEIYESLKDQGAAQIFTTEDDEIVSTVNGQNVKYYKESGQDTYSLEVEQKVTILNIGLGTDAQGTNISYGLTNLRIKTNIKADELKKFLKAANYLYYQASSQTPLKNSDATLNWVLKNGYYIAEFSGSNNNAITKEAEILFRKMNIAAQRDLRLVNDEFTAIYTYTTNYTDKTVLINTLTEHGAEELVENGDEVSCKLFGMEMVYYKKDGSNGYTLDVTQVSNKATCEDLITDLNDEYGLNIQEITYNKIKERLDAENMRLESETVMDDNSIVLTIEI